jgi:hypothetical protein
VKFRQGAQKDGAAFWQDRAGAANGLLHEQVLLLLRRNTQQLPASERTSS